MGIRGSGAAMWALVWGVGGCNWLIGLDDVSLGGAGGTTTGGGGVTGSGGFAGGTGGVGGTTGSGGFAGSTGGTGGVTGGTGGVTGGTGGVTGGTGGVTGGTGGVTVTGCVGDGDCAAPLVCEVATGMCVAPTCDDLKLDGDETGTDCGGPMCPACGTGVGCTLDSDCISGVCTGTCQAPACGDGVVNGAEGCDDGNGFGGDGCSSGCAVEMGFGCTGTAPSVCVATCGDAQVLGGEQCDDGNGMAGDGCSAGCKVEPLYQCQIGPPGACTKQETRCQNGADDDGDGVADELDTDCLLPGYYPQLGCSSVWVYRSVDVPAAIPDNTDKGGWSVIVVPDDVAVMHMSVVLHVTHPRDSDLVATLVMPFGQPRTLMNQSGGNGANFEDTVFDSTCAMSVGNGGAPFAGCYKPQSFFPNGGQAAKGVWALEVEDRAPGQTGTLDGWTLVICGP